MSGQARPVYASGLILGRPATQTAAQRGCGLDCALAAGVEADRIAVAFQMRDGQGRRRKAGMVKDRHGDIDDAARHIAFADLMAGGANARVQR